ncbi:hypothetical protein ACFV2X_42940 [Streptomyces sp. NPDC059679]|uniref:hypothetical protein n=1 Tax=Streptomyces sp. NPDC059679 TaxID=3346903 RepID=UPI0036CFBE89
MTSGDVGRRRDRAHAFVPELIPEPADLDRTGPLDTREQRDLERIHAARDNHQNARWMRGKALEAAFRRRLFRGEDGTRTRQEYLNDEWDGISESAAYLEIKEWRLAAQIAQTCDRPAPDSHVRALVDVAQQRGHEVAALQYHELRLYGAERGLKVTAIVVQNLATYLATGETPATKAPELQTLFTPRQLLPPAKRKDPIEPTDSSPREGVLTGEASDSAPEDGFQNFGIPESRQASAATDGDQGQSTLDLSAEQAAQASDMLDGMCVGFVEGGLLPHARTDTLRAILASAQAIATAAEEELKKR